MEIERVSASVLILIGFALGVVVVVAIQALGVLWILSRLSSMIKKRGRDKSDSLVLAEEPDTRQSLNFAFKKQGVVWVLELEKIPKSRPSTELKRKKEFVEVSPVKKCGKVMGQSLILTEPDGLSTTISLKGCIVEAVSSSRSSSKKWAKKLPIKVESKTSEIYNGSKIFYIYLATSWEKEAWCKALRLASCDQSDKFKCFVELHEDFRSYVISLNAEYSFMKPSVGSSVEAIDRASKLDSASSKVRQFLKKMSKKNSKAGSDNKSMWTPLPGCEERKNTEKPRALQDSVLVSNLMKSASSKHLKSSVEDNALPLLSTLSRSRSQTHIPFGFGTGSDEKCGIDEATLCWNLLIFRLFFDIKRSAELKEIIQEKIKRQLTMVRTPSYIGEIILTGFNIGNFPPCIIGLRVIPVEMCEVWTLEVDIDYSGGVLMEIETRLDVRELDLFKEIEDPNPDSSNAEDVPANLLEGFEYVGKKLNPAEGMSDSEGPKEDGDGNTDVSKSLKSASSSSGTKSKWKSMLNSVAKQVSQVPLCLAIRIASLKGTLRVYIKPPPSDQLWYGFTSMPDIDFKLESSIGDHKFTSGQIANLLVKLFKIGIRENVVLPNTESICIPFMLAEKDDWLPYNVAPFLWAHQESRNETATSVDTPNQELRTSSYDSENELQNPESAESRSAGKSIDAPSSSINAPSRLEELRTPLLEKEHKDKRQESGELKELGLPPLDIRDSKLPRPPSLQTIKSPETKEPKLPRAPSLPIVKTPETSQEEMTSKTCPSSPNKAVTLLGRQFSMDGTKPKKTGRKEKMIDFRRKMSEKFEEKKRSIEEKSRSFVERMRGS